MQVICVVLIVLRTRYSVVLIICDGAADSRCSRCAGPALPWPWRGGRASASGASARGSCPSPCLQVIIYGMVETSRLVQHTLMRATR